MMRDLFLLDPQVAFLNHGSFGATPRPVFAEYQRRQVELERQPVRFFSRLLWPALAEARAALAASLGAAPDDLAFVPNATYAANVVARSLLLSPGDEVLSTDHEYGACSNAWTWAVERAGAAYRRLPVDPAAPQAMADQLWAGVTPATRVIYLSHITSPTALRLPVEEICRRAAPAGILTVVDGAHAPGQIPLDLAQLGADFYFGNCHKWMCAPKGSAFLWARPAAQPLVEPLVAGWGWGPEKANSLGSDFLDAVQRVGTDDLAAYLAVPAALDFQTEHDWPAQRARCRALLAAALERIAALTGLPRFVADDPALWVQMAVAPLPPLANPPATKARLIDEFGVEVPLVRWRGQDFVRVSVQAYNDEGDIERLVAALAAVLPGAAQE